MGLADTVGGFSEGTVTVCLCTDMVARSVHGVAGGYGWRMTDAPHLPTAGGLAFRAGGPENAPIAVCLHGWPESSWMWRPTLAALAAKGIRGLAPDLPGYGESPVVRPGTWAMHVAAFGEFVDAVSPDAPVALCVHDWGGLIGLRWACDNPGRVSVLTISDTGFFADSVWHGLADMMRTPEQGEELIRGITREGFGGMLGAVSTGIDDAAVDEYYRAFATDEHRLAQLDLYRSGEMSELEAYDGKLGALGVPTLLLWGGKDEFAPVSGAHRFKAAIPGAELVVLDDAGHFIAEDAPEEFAETVSAFVAGVLNA